MFRGECGSWTIKAVCMTGTASLIYATARQLSISGRRCSQVWYVKFLLGCNHLVDTLMIYSMNSQTRCGKFKNTCTCEIKVTHHGYVDEEYTVCMYFIGILPQLYVTSICFILYLLRRLWRSLGVGLLLIFFHPAQFIFKFFVCI